MKNSDGFTKPYLAIARHSRIRRIKPPVLFVVENHIIVGELLEELFSVLVL